MIETIKNILSKLGLFNIVRTMVKKPFNSIRSYFFRKNVLKTFQKLLSILEEEKIEAFLVFGTLLGAIREKGFIKHDLDLDFGVVRVRKSGSSAGNNGLKSLISVFGEDFARMKIGIKNEFLPKIGAMNFVLAKFSKNESEKLPQIFKICEDFVEDFAKDSLENNKRSI